MTDQRSSSASAALADELERLKEASDNTFDGDPYGGSDTQDALDQCVNDNFSAIIDALRGVAQAAIGRDAIAKIIDPDCARALVTEREWCEKWGKTFETFAAGYIRRWNVALAKADAILAASSLPSTDWAAAAERAKAASDKVLADAKVDPTELQKPYLVP